LNYVQTLVCIGYGFGDAHINDIIRGWLEFGADRSIEIVDPNAEDVPAQLLHLAPQVRLNRTTATEYFDRTAGIVRSKREQMEKRLGLWAQGVGNSKEAQARLGKFLENNLKSRVEAFADKMKTLPWRDGDVDLEALGLTKEEFVEKYKIVSDSPEDVLESFLASQEA
jgi:hypothetical protein